ncbi:hypothetical protein [Micromonospora rubida]
MHPNPIPTPDLTAATAALRALYAAGWRPDTVTPLDGGAAEHHLIHPSGRTITAVTDRPAECIDLDMRGLSLDQAVGAVTGAGLAPGATPTPDLLAAVRAVIAAGHLDAATDGDVEGIQGEAHAALIAAYEAATGGTTDATTPAEPTVRERLAAELHRIAEAIVREDLPLPDGYMRADLHLGILDSRADLDRWADYLGSPAKVNPANSIPSIKRAIKLGTRATLRVGLQADADPRSEVEILRAEVAELRAQQAGGAL